MKTRYISKIGALAAVFGGLLPGAACDPVAPRSVPTPESSYVSIGYGKVPARDVTGAIGSMIVRRDEASRFSHVEEMLTARIPGVDVVRHRSGFSVRIRGMRSFHGDNDALVVVDGIPLNGTAGGLLGLSPHDVERIDVLKDAAATAIYGARGGNGVVLITTRRPR